MSSDAKSILGTSAEVGGEGDYIYIPIATLSEDSTQGDITDVPSVGHVLPCFEIVFCCRRILTRCPLSDHSYLPDNERLLSGPLPSGRPVTVARMARSSDPMLCHTVQVFLDRKSMVYCDKDPARCCSPSRLGQPQPYHSFYLHVYRRRERDCH